jgi:hypothetical protein
MLITIPWREWVVQSQTGRWLLQTVITKEAHEQVRVTFDGWAASKTHTDNAPWWSQLTPRVAGLHEKGLVVERLALTF